MTHDEALQWAEDAGYADDWGRALSVVMHPVEHGVTTAEANAAWRRGRDRGKETPVIHYAPRRSITRCGHYVHRQQHPAPRRYKITLPGVTCPFCLQLAEVPS